MYLISYPKSGRTWLRALVGSVLSSKLGEDPPILFKELILTRRLGILGMITTHDGSATTHGMNFQELPKDKKIYKEHKVLLLGRNIHDILVSSYFQATKRENIYKGSIPEFIRSGSFGARKILQFYQNWYFARTVPQDLMFLRYENLHKDTIGCFRKVIDFCEMGTVSEKIIDKALKFAQFSNLKKMESSGTYSDKGRLVPGDPNDEESYKIRRGQIGGYINYLSQEDIVYVDQMLQKYGCEFTRVIS